MGRSLEDLIGKIEKFKDTEGNISIFYFKKTEVIHYNLFGIIPLGKSVKYDPIPSFTRKDRGILRDRIERFDNCKVDIINNLVYKRKNE